MFLLSKSQTLAEKESSFPQVASSSKNGVSFPFLREADEHLHSLYAYVLVDIANTLSPSPLPSHVLPRGIPEITQGEKPPYHITYDASKQERILGIKYHTKLETTRDTLAEFASRGW